MRITCIGGGTGLFHILMGLKDIPKILLTSIVSMSDSGGSSGRLRASFGMLPPGDIRRSLVALSDAPKIMNQLMQYRFERGEGVEGHSVGNLFLTALTEIKGSFPEAVRTISEILNVRGIVLPVTHNQNTLCAEYDDGSELKGEDKIDMCANKNPLLKITRVWHEPPTQCSIDSFASIINSDIVTIGPGDLFTSIASNLVVRNISDALKETNAKKIYFCNLMTKPGETFEYTAYDHVMEIIKYMGGDYLDYVVLSDTKLSNRSIHEYSKKKQSPVTIESADRLHRITRAKIIIVDIGDATELVRHDSRKIKNAMNNIIQFESTIKNGDKNDM